MDSDRVLIGCWSIGPDFVDEIAIQFEQTDKLKALQMVFPFVPQVVGNCVRIGTDTRVRSELRLIGNS